MNSDKSNHAMNENGVASSDMKAALLVGAMMIEVLGCLNWDGSYNIAACAWDK